MNFKCGDMIVWYDDNCIFDIGIKVHPALEYSTYIYWTRRKKRLVYTNDIFRRALQNESYVYKFRRLE